MTFNPTTNRVSFGLLDQHERIALTRWPHGWKYYDRKKDCWVEAIEPNWHDVMVYRGKPAPQEDV